MVPNCNVPSKKTDTDVKPNVNPELITRIVNKIYSKVRGFFDNTRDGRSM